MESEGMMVETTNPENVLFEPNFDTMIEAMADDHSISTISGAHKAMATTEVDASVFKGHKMYVYNDVLLSFL